MSAETPPKEKSVPAERISRDALDEATPTTEPSTDVWVCGLNRCVTIHPTVPAPADAQVAQDQPEDVLAIRPKRSTHWRGHSATRRTTLEAQREVITMIARILTWLESDLAQNITGLLVAAVLLLLF